MAIKKRRIPQVSMRTNIRKNPRHFKDIITSIEIGLGISIPPKKIKKIKTLGDLYKIVSPMF